MSAIARYRDCYPRCDCIEISFAAQSCVTTLNRSYATLCFHSSKYTQILFKYKPVLRKK